LSNGKQYRREQEKEEAGGKMEKIFDSRWIVVNCGQHGCASKEVKIKGKMHVMSTPFNCFEWTQILSDAAAEINPSPH